MTNRPVLELFNASVAYALAITRAVLTLDWPAAKRAQRELIGAAIAIGRR